MRHFYRGDAVKSHSPQGLMTDRKPKAAGEIQWINKLFDVAA
jgi:hypothetical protein